MNLFTLFRGALIEGTGSHELAALFACIVSSALLLVSTGLGSLIEADHCRQHCRHHDDAQDHGGEQDEKTRCRYRLRRGGCRCDWECYFAEGL